MSEFLTWNQYHEGPFIPDSTAPIVVVILVLVLLYILAVVAATVVGFIVDRFFDKDRIAAKADRIDQEVFIASHMPPGFYCYVARNRTLEEWAWSCTTMRRNCEKCPFAIRILTTGKRRRK